MKKSLRADDFCVVTGEVAYDIALPSSLSEITLDIRCDSEFHLYAVAPETVVPIFHGSHFSWRGSLEGFEHLQVVLKDRSAVLAYAITAYSFRDGQPVDPERIVIPMEDASPDLALNRAVQMMVRAQLRAAGIDPDQDARDFGDGDMEFDDETDDFGGSSWYDDDPQPVRDSVAERQAEPAVPSAPPPNQTGSSPAESLTTPSATAPDEKSKS